eukprot:6115474-Amphidinium_carterae.1
MEQSIPIFWPRDPNPEVSRTYVRGGTCGGQEVLSLSIAGLWWFGESASFAAPAQLSTTSLALSRGSTS